MLDHLGWEMLWRLLSAAGLAGIVGLDRQLAGKAAGLRTHMMVGLGSAAFTTTAVELVATMPDADPTRIITGVATGIGFLGAGSIMKAGGEIEGITTAAGIWVVGAIGVACGLGAYTLALATTILAALILVILGRVSRRKSHAGTPIIHTDAARKREPDDVTEQGIHPSID
jgi:putative Mg2+ transporter-C (MgtC) family protein